MEKQAFIDKALAEAIKKLEEEVGGLLGQEFSCSAHGGQFTDPAQALAAFEEKGTVVEMAVSGDQEARAFILLSLKDAIVLGGTLILLPDEELEERCQNFDFDGELADAYGEIANIVAGVYTAIFADRGTVKLHFKKTELDSFSPGSTDAVPPGAYYSTVTSLEMEGNALGQMQVLFPCDIFGLTPPQPADQAAADGADSPSGPDAETRSAVGAEDLEPSAAPKAQAAAETLGGGPAEPLQSVSPLQAAAQAAANKLKETSEPKAPGPSSASGSQMDEAGNAPAELSPLQAAAQAAAAKLGGSGGSEMPAQASRPGQQTLILVVSEDRETAQAFAEPLCGQGSEEVLCLNYQDSLREATAERNIRGVFLVMKEVGERGFASVIKIQSALNPTPPLVVAGPQWTRSAVLKAVKYGACDVLITPIEANELLHKLHDHMSA